MKRSCNNRSTILGPVAARMAGKKPAVPSMKKGDNVANIGVIAPKVP